MAGPHDARHLTAMVLRFAHLLAQTPAVGAVFSGRPEALSMTGAVRPESSGARNHLAKVRVAGSNFVVRSKKSQVRGVAPMLTVLQSPGRASSRSSSGAGDERGPLWSAGAGGVGSSMRKR